MTCFQQQTMALWKLPPLDYSAHMILLKLLWKLWCLFWISTVSAVSSALASLSLPPFLALGLLKSWSLVFLLLSVVHQFLSRLVLLNVFTLTLPVKSINQHLLCGISTCTPLICFPLWMLWNPGILQPPQLDRYVGSTLTSVLSFILFFK